ncbi:bifunctional DNA primase/polymerase [Microbacterium maritypicum]
MATEETRNDAREPRDGFAEVMTRVSPAWRPAVAAREFAAAGVPVFPCAPGGKRPVTENGFHDATTEARQVDVWWRARPGANIGMPTGEVSGVVVVDVDVHGPVNGCGSMRRAQQAGLVDGWMFLVATPSGGTHAYYPAVPGQQQRSWQAARAAVDFRGDGGYIVLPPSSVLVNGARAGYRLQQLGSGPSAPVDAAGLRDFLDPRPQPRSLPRNAAMSGAASDVSRLAAWVANRQEGERNRGLFWAACRLAENGVNPVEALDLLGAAAGHAGLAEREIVTTVRSAYRAAHPSARERTPDRPGGSFARAPAPAAPAPAFGGLS